MFFTLLLYYLFHIRKIKALMAVYHFRKCRENPLYQTASMDELFHVVAKWLHMEQQVVAEAVQKWMFEVPLEIIKKCAFDDVIAFANEKKKEGNCIIIYSDYPAARKLEKLAMPCDYIFISGEANLPELKPSIIAMEYILQTTQCSACDLLYIGDRDEKDGVSARLVNMSYWNIRQLRKWLKQTHRFIKRSRQVRQNRD